MLHSHPSLKSERPHSGQRIEEVTRRCRSASKTSSSVKTSAENRCPQLLHRLLIDLGTAYPPNFLPLSLEYSSTKPSPCSIEIFHFGKDTAVPLVERCKPSRKMIGPKAPFENLSDFVAISNETPLLNSAPFGTSYGSDKQAISTSNTNLGTMMPK